MEWLCQHLQHGPFAHPAAVEQRVHDRVVDEGGAAFVHHLGLPLRVEVLRDDAHDAQDLALPRLQNQAVLFQEIEQVLLRQLQRLLALPHLLLRLLRGPAVLAGG